MAQMKRDKAERNKDPTWVYNEEDPVFGDYIPEYHQ